MNENADCDCEDYCSACECINCLSKRQENINEDEDINDS